MSGWKRQWLDRPIDRQLGVKDFQVANKKKVGSINKTSDTKTHRSYKHI